MIKTIKRVRFSETIEDGAAVLNSGGILIYPTEGVYGIGPLPSYSKSMWLLRRAKERPNELGFILVVSSIEQLDGYVDLDKLDHKLLYSRLKMSSIEFPLTWVLPSYKRLSPDINGDTGRVAVRLTSFQPIARLCSLVDSPIVSTSLNARGGCPARTIEDAVNLSGLLGVGDSILLGELGGSKRTSAIYDFDTLAPLRGEHPELVGLPNPL